MIVPVAPLATEGRIPTVVLVSGGVARISDFGLAQLREEPVATLGASDAGALADTEINLRSPQLTRANDLFGTPGYMAPELALGSSASGPPADVFAFGVLACEMLTGRQPYAEPPLLARLGGRPVVRPALDDLDATVARCLDLDPARRPTSAEIVAALEAVGR